MNMYDKIKWVQRSIIRARAGNRNDLEQAEQFICEIRAYIEKMIEPSNMFFELDVKGE